ncbi:MAG: matrixin family metalloprotease [Planctomycetes bacterium]|nr:matrixin family metalloprotease [Planctomycetota bacterium]
MRSIASATTAAAAFVGAALLVRPPSAQAFDVTGDALDVFHRTVRVFDNFHAATANANSHFDTAFPGYNGAELAIWKAAIEWSSERHGSGSGDPQQPLDLGSGGANFDYVWLGLATGVGSIDDNTCSELPGSGAGVIAFTETPTSDGWRIRFYGNQNWYDDPNKTQFFNSLDLQGVATHELGHALGLNHSSTPTATMSASISGSGLPWRSIESDDVAGVQSIYGAKSAAKPHIQTYTFPSAGMVRVLGAGFAAQQNELWFTPSVVGSSTPVIVSGLVSTAGGTEILAPLPAGIGGGDVLVKVPGSAHDTLSSPCPFDLAGPPCETPKTYGVAKLTSTGSNAEIGWFGEASVTTADLELTLSGPPGGSPAVLFWGTSKQQATFRGGLLSVGAPLRRHATTQLDFFQFASALVTVTPSMVGTTRYYQWWYADAADPAGCGTSDALELFFCP